MYECEHCGLHFEEYDTIEETHGLDCGPYEVIAVCPHCHSSFEELEQCEICGEWYTQDEVISGVCDSCVYSRSEDIDLCYKLGGEDDALESVKLNGFVASIFSPEQINHILMNCITEINSFTTISCYKFIGNDKSWFAEKLKEVHNAEEL